MFSKLESYLYLQLAVRSLASGEQLVSLLKRLVQVVDMREPVTTVSKHHVYHKALMYDIDVGGILFDSFFMSDIDLLIIHKIISKLSFSARVGT